MSDKSFYSEAKKVMPVDFLPSPNKIGLGYTILNPFKHFLKKKELFTPAEAAEMRRSRNRTRKVSLKITKISNADGNGDSARVATVENKYDYDMKYPNESLNVDNIDLTVKPIEDNKALNKESEGNKGKPDGRPTLFLINGCNYIACLNVMIYNYDTPFIQY